MKTFLALAITLLMLNACDLSSNVNDSTNGRFISSCSFDNSSPDNHIFFATDSSVIESDGQNILNSQAAWLKQHNSVNIVIEGHTDERGTREYNIALGERRASTAKVYLVGQGVAASRISTISYGKERPAVPGNEDAAWSQNRRAVTWTID